MPSSGYVADLPTSSIRPITGFVGSAVLGPSVLDNLVWASVAPNQKSALVQQGDSVVWIADLAYPDRSQALDHVPPAQRAFWSADSKRAVILTIDFQLIWLTNFDSNPRPEATWQLDATLPSAGIGPGWSLLAADSSADRVLLSVSVDGPSLWTSSRTLPPAAVPLALHPAAAAFANKSDAVFVVDSNSKSVVRIDGLDGTASMTALLSSGDYVSSPAGIVLSQGDDQFMLADRSSFTIRSFDTGSGSLLAEIPADALPQSMTSVTPGCFLLESTATLPADAASQPMYFLLTNAPAHVMFVPRGK